MRIYLLFKDNEPQSQHNTKNKNMAIVWKKFQQTPTTKNTKRSVRFTLTTHHRSHGCQTVTGCLLSPN
jgi:hypothetical protein